ncbi:DHH family phosphoesterase [Pseudobutyrivibrio xylanivorans]|uniref:NanoRNase/pAp phosphatase, hydrolyzes c-di-AMP and oligoRNAs n=1 Tax=Pseudobutyrivibrio xylanivorans TaxID=185007 RepID=A0A1G5RYY2_PSEXY|nr:DHH family phosphoesterase [Pseudobutyrivibrio xylanivorans]SCZ79137.1 nanoRNase/pAp phosphatase, hydrolyzes c-di-AMP and oligoRNAs [Pseudobutyrivibrio xylanivorans]
MKLTQLLDYNNIIVQCHNTPDADAIASGMALTQYLRAHDKTVAFVYGGNFEITKSNLKLMISDLGVDIHYVRHQAQLSQLLGIREQELPELIVTVDCQYGEGNVRIFKARQIAVIDHHQISNPLPELSEIRSYLASCSTILWDMLKEEGYPVEKDKKLSTALYYGLMTDSNNFSEIQHPLDMDMRDYLKYSNSAIIKFKNSNISQEELRIAGIALLGSEYYHENHYSIVKTDPCDPNILGIISDMMLQVEDVESCLAYSIHEGGIKLSVRSCVKEVKADELAKFICQGVGDGGGHLTKAGGFIVRSLLERQELDYTPSAIQHFFRERMDEYFMDNEIIYAGKYSADISTMDLYKSKGVTIGYVKGSEIFPVGTKAVIRAMEGDQELEIKEDTIIAVGVRGEVYITKVELFDKYYKICDKKYEFPGEYAPSIRKLKDRTAMGLLPLVHSCTYEGNGNIYAKELMCRTKVFTKWNPENYCLGRPGDYMVVTQDDPTSVYVVDKELFEKTYAPVE